MNFNSPLDWTFMIFYESMMINGCVERQLVSLLKVKIIIATLLVA